MESNSLKVLLELGISSYANVAKSHTLMPAYVLRVTLDVADFVCDLWPQERLV